MTTERWKDPQNEVTKVKRSDILMLRVIFVALGVMVLEPRINQLAFQEISGE